MLLPLEPPRFSASVGTLIGLRQSKPNPILLESAILLAADMGAEILNLCFSALLPETCKSVLGIGDVKFTAELKFQALLKSETHAMVVEIFVSG